MILSSRFSGLDCGAGSWRHLDPFPIWCIATAGSYMLILKCQGMPCTDTSLGERV